MEHILFLMRQHRVYWQIKGEKSMNERKSYQLYMLEGELEKVQFEYDCEYRSTEHIENRMRDFMFSIKLGAVYLVILVICILLLTVALSEEEFSVPLILMQPFLFFGCIVLHILAFGAFYKAKFGMSYFKMKEQKEEREEKLLIVTQKLNKLTLQKEQLEEEIALETKEQEVEQEFSQRWEESVQRENIQCKIEMLQYKKEREEKEYRAAQLELQNVMKEEEKVRQQKKKHTFHLWIGIVGLIIGFVMWTSANLTISLIGKTSIILFTMLVILPSLFLWLSKHITLSVGEELWLNRVLFKEMYEYSYPKRQEKLQREIETHNQNMKEIEKEQKQLEEEKRKLYE